MQAASPATPTTEFAPLPLRPRGVLEILDMAIKVYGKYFWILLGWSALVNIGTVLASFVGGSFLSWLISPLLLGAVMCCIAAAVRGQKVEFNQCWQFTRPRYGPLIGMLFLSGIIAVLVACMCAFAGVMVMVGLGIGFGGFGNTSTPQMILFVIVGVIVFTVLFTIITAAFIWQYMVQVVVCMEEDKQNTKSMGRAWELLKGHWVRVCTLMTVLSLGILVLTLIIWTVGFLTVGVTTLRDVFNSTQPPSAAVIAMFAVIGLGTMAVWLTYTPIFYITIGLFYLDIRIRKEALDLEWAAHSSQTTATPPAGPAPYYMAPGTAPGAGTAPPGYAPSPATQPFTPPNTPLANEFAGQGAYPPATAPPAYIPPDTTPVEATATPVETPTPVPPTIGFPGYGTDATPVPIPEQPVQAPGPPLTPTSTWDTPTSHTAQTSPLPTSDVPATPELSATPEVYGAPALVNEPFTATAPFEAMPGSPPPMPSMGTPGTTDAVYAPESPTAPPVASPMGDMATGATTTCRECGEEAPATQTFCMKCGARLSQS